MTRRLSPETLAAFHEAGRAVAACKLNLSVPERVSILASGDDQGHGQTGEAFRGRADILRTALDEPLPAGAPVTHAVGKWQHRFAWESRAMADLAGYAAEWRRQRLSRVGGAVALIRILDRGPSRGRHLASVIEHLDAIEPDESARRRWLLVLWDRTCRLLGASWRDVERVAAALVQEQTLDRGMLLALLSLRTEEA